MEIGQLVNDLENAMKDHPGVASQDGKVIWPPEVEDASKKVEERVHKLISRAMKCSDPTRQWDFHEAMLELVCFNTRMNLKKLPTG